MILWGHLALAPGFHSTLHTGTLDPDLQLTDLSRGDGTLVSISASNLDSFLASILFILSIQPSFSNFFPSPLLVLFTLTLVVLPPPSS